MILASAHHYSPNTAFAYTATPTNNYSSNNHAACICTMSKLSKQAPTTVEIGNEESKKAKAKGVVVREEEVEQSLDGEAVGEQVEGCEDGQGDTKRLKLERKKAGQEEEDERSIVMSGGSIDGYQSAATPTTTNGDETALAVVNSTSDSSNDDTIDTRSPTATALLSSPPSPSAPPVTKSPKPSPYPYPAYPNAAVFLNPAASPSPTSK
jgi:hypothetical protein